jgi:hypothetical protein
MTSAKLHDYELAAALVLQLAPLQAVALQLDRLDPNVHPHGACGIVVVADDVRHVLAVVSGTKIEIDGPRPASPAYRDAESEEAQAAVARQLRGIATAWLADEPLLFGVFDLAIALVSAYEIHGFRLGTDTSLSAAGAHVSALRDGVRVAAGLSLRATAAGVHLRCGPLERIVRVPTDLDDFEQREHPELLRQLGSDLATE